MRVRTRFPIHRHDTPSHCQCQRPVPGRIGISRGTNGGVWLAEAGLCWKTGTPSLSSDSTYISAFAGQRFRGLDDFLVGWWAGKQSLLRL
jgi:hypothetical protein